MVDCPTTGIGVQPRCCKPGLTPCSRCSGGKAPLYFEVTLGGIFDKTPSNCPSCPRYNAATFTLSPQSDDCTYGGFEGVLDDTPCCWRCFINPNEMDCLTSPGAPGVINLVLAETSGTYYLIVELDDRSANRHVRFRKSYGSLPDCRNLVAESIPWLSNGASGRCAGDGSATCLVTAKTSITDPCCRDFCHPDETPGPITIVVAGLTNGDCPCSGLNGTYVLTRQKVIGSQNQCWVARFPEVCGMDAITSIIGTSNSKVIFYNAATYPSGNVLEFDLTHLSPFSSYFTAPYADCNQWNGIEFRSGGSSPICGVSGSYATATMSF